MRVQFQVGRRVSCLGLMLAALAGGCGGDATAAAADTASKLGLGPIVLVTIDTLRADHVGTYGYFRDTSPVLDRLGEEGVVFENTVTSIPTTTPSHVAMFTGRYPLQTGVLANGKRFHGNAERSQNHFLAEQLRHIGYDTAAFVSAAPVLSVTGLDAGFDTYDELERSAGERPSHETMDAALAWLDDDPGEPFFVWIHMFAPHWPYDPPPPYDASFTADDELVAFLESQGFSDPYDPDVQSMHDRYDGEILYADAQVGRLIEKLKAMGVYDETTLVVTSDHGEGLGQHGIFGHGDLTNAQLFVPLIAKFPASLGVNGQRHQPLVSLIDIVPTLVEQLGLPFGPEVLASYEGGDAWTGTASREALLAQHPMKAKKDREAKRERKAGDDEDEPNEKAEMKQAEGRINERGRDKQHFALLSEGWKLTMLDEGGFRLHDLRTDRNDLRDLAAAHPERVAAMEAALHELVARLTSQSGTLEVLDETAPEIVEELRALGYL